MYERSLERSRTARQKDEEIVVKHLSMSELDQQEEVAFRSALRDRATPNRGRIAPHASSPSSPRSRSAPPPVAFVSPVASVASVPAVASHPVVDLTESPPIGDSPVMGEISRDIFDANVYYDDDEYNDENAPVNNDNGGDMKPAAVDDGQKSEISHPYEGLFRDDVSGDDDGELPVIDSNDDDGESLEASMYALNFD